LRYRVLGACMGALVLAGWALPSESIFWRVYTSPLLLEFLIGVGIQFSYERGIVLPRWMSVCLLVTGFIGLAQASVWSGFSAAAVVLGAIHACRGWSVPSLRLIGDASYSIYLSHLFSFVPIGRLCRAIGFATPDAMSIGAVIALHVLLATIAGIAVHFVIERPLIPLSRHLWDRLGKLVAPPVPS